MTQLVAMIKSTPPSSAAGLLTAMPADRLPLVVGALPPADVLRLLPALRPDTRAAVLAVLSIDQLAAMLRILPGDQAVSLLTELPAGRLPAVAGAVPDGLVPALLATLPPERRDGLLAAMDPRQARAALATGYQRDVFEALVRANAEVSVPPGTPDGIVLVQNLGWRIVVAARYGDDGSVAVRDAEDAAYRMRASGALSVTNGEPAAEVLRYCRDAQRAGRPLETAVWADARHDGQLKRTLVGLFH
ncbi:hypothetical protein O7627_08880 [Solwaraspora sp. WMMD1047]|uniref:magnesium transporter MgtE N-terminal domain-containing protein n=1 Tax=Solwaraspora sp. WMMD1047 TaxID=3016102 RepID=UPI002416566A|nr:hypothetical protein [Solwaraspora sp. WMMD1047]MDG4829417.1 hypothetical protein [Solwaraspora sp. WMMD1047]